MAQLLHIRCRHCGEELTNRATPYCPTCNLALCYRAMPLLLGMLMTGQLQFRPAYVSKGVFRPQSNRGYDDLTMLVWE